MEICYGRPRKLIRSPSRSGTDPGVEARTAKSPLTAPSPLPCSPSRLVTCLGAEHIQISPFCGFLAGLLVSGGTGQYGSGNQEI